jgi:hypothetical protein
MKKLFVLFITLFSINLLACSIHSFKIELDNKVLLRTNSFHAHTLVKNNDIWDLEIKLTKKVQTKFENILNKNQGNELIYSFDKQIVKINPDINSKLIKISLSLNEDDVKSLQKDCGAKK